MPDQLDLLSMVRPSDPSTSRLAAMRTDRAKGKRQVRAFFAAHPHESFTDQEVAAATGMVLGSAQKRRKDLEREGVVEFSGEYGVTAAGSPSRKHRLVTS